MQRFHPQQSGRGPSPMGAYTKAFVLLIVLVVVWLVANNIVSRGLPNAFMDIINEDSDTDAAYQVLSETEKTHLVSLLSGFWTAQPPEGEQQRAFAIDDHIELKDNGIIWRAIVQKVFLPSGDTAEFRHAYDAYLRPHGWVADRDSVVACDVRILRQVRIAGADTCFGPTDVDVVWNVGIDSGRVMLDRTAYTRYTGDIHEFFPVGAIDLVERGPKLGIEDQEPAYEAKRKGEIRLNTPSADAPRISLTPDRCADSVNPGAFARRRLAGAYAHDTVAALSAEEASRIVENGYAPALRRDIAARLPAHSTSRDTRLEVSFAVRPDGGVENVVVEGSARGGRLTNVVVDLVKSWRFPVARTADAPVAVTWHGEI